jgi:hypothetical protein
MTYFWLFSLLLHCFLASSSLLFSVFAGFLHFPLRYFFATQSSEAVAKQ